jgi:exodeoxyribonuclease-3
MRLATFNVNSIRKRLDHIKVFQEKQKAEIIGLQEIKCVDADFPQAELSSLGLHSEFYGQKTHYGVAIVSEIAPFEVIKGIEAEGDQKRFIHCKYNTSKGILNIINCYFPNGESRDTEKKFTMKNNFYHGVQEYIKANFTENDLIALMGDFNVAYLDTDIGITPDSVKRWLKEGKCSFLPEEREWFSGFFSLGLHDAYRKIHPQKNDLFSWFDYRSKGFEQEPKRGLRIDTILVSAPLADLCVNAGIDYETRAMESPSDHCPVWADFDL